MLKKYKTFSVPKTKEVKSIGKNGEQITKSIFYRLQFIDSTRFMASLSSNLDDCAKFNETSFPEKEYFHSHLNMEYISDADYMHAKRFCKGFEINLGEYHDLYVHSDTLLLADAKLYGWAISQKLLIDGSK